MLRLPSPKLLSGMRPVGRDQVPREILAGITLAALAIPSSMGYTAIAGMPVITGLYTVLLPTAIFAIIGSSRHLVVGADSATAAILAAGIGGMAAAQSSQYIALAGMIALLAGAFLLLARIARLGFIADFLSRTVLIGFLTGVGIQVAIGQIPGLFGVPKQGQGPIQQLWNVVADLSDASWATFAVAAGVIVLIRGGKMIAPRLPMALVAVVGSIALSDAFDFESHGITTIGPVASGLPDLSFPSVPLDDMSALAGVALSLFVVILAQSAATSRAYASKYSERADENVDLVGLALANASAGLTGAFVVNGSPTKTQMVDNAGGRTQFANLTMAGIVLVVLLFLTGPLQYLPNAVLAAIVFLVGLDLIDIAAMRHVYVQRRDEFVVAAITTLLVVFVGVLQGIVAAVVLSIIIHLRLSYQPRDTLETRTSDGHIHAVALSTRSQLLPGLAVYRFSHSIYFANAGHLSEEVLALVEDSEPPPEWVCIDASAIADIDVTGADTLREIHGQLSARAVRLVLSSVSDDVRAELEHYGTLEMLGGDALFDNVGDVATAFAAREVAG